MVRLEGWRSPNKQLAVTDSQQEGIWMSLIARYVTLSGILLSVSVVRFSLQLTYKVNIMINDFINIVRALAKLDIKSFRMLASLRGKLRTYAIYRCLDVQVDKYGEVPSNPTAEGRAEVDETLKDAQDSANWEPMVQAVSMLVALDDEFGVWEKDEGIAGSLDYQIEAHTPKLSRDAYSKLVKGAKGSLKEYDEMVATRDQLERFKDDILSMLTDVQENQIRDEATDAEWAYKFMSEAGQKQKDNMATGLLRGWITEEQYSKGTDELDAFIWLGVSEATS